MTHSFVYDVPIKHGRFRWQTVALPEGIFHEYSTISPFYLHWATIYRWFSRSNPHRTTIKTIKSFPWYAHYICIKPSFIDGFPIRPPFSPWFETRPERLSAVASAFAVADSVACKSGNTLGIWGGNVGNILGVWCWSIYICVFIYICVCLYICVYIYVYTYAYIYIYVCVCLFVYIYYIYICMCVCLYTYMYMFIYIYVCVYLYICVFICIYT